MAGVVLLTTLAACSSGDAEPSAQASATVSTAPATTTTTDPYAVPAVINAAYVNRVLAGLDAVSGDVIRLILRTRTFPPEGFDRLKSIYGTDAQLDRILDSLSRDIAQGMSGYRPDPGNKITRVAEILSATPTCIFARVERDYTPVASGPAPTSDLQWIALKPADPSRDVGGYNSVTWAYVYEGFERGRVAPETSPCAGS